MPPGDSGNEDEEDAEVEEECQTPLVPFRRCMPRGFLAKDVLPVILFVVSQG